MPIHPTNRLVQPRRAFLADVGMGFVGLALGAMMHRDGVALAGEASDRTALDRLPHSPPRARRVIWLMMRGGVSHLESFDPKPALERHAGKTIGESPFHSKVFDSPYIKNVREQVANNIIDKQKARIYPTQIGFTKGGRSGTAVSDWWPHVRECVDDIAVIRSMFTTDNNHGAQLEFLTGRHLLDGCYPTLGAWIHYGLGALSDDLPQFIAMGPAWSRSAWEAWTPTTWVPNTRGFISMSIRRIPCPLPVRESRSAVRRRRSRPKSSAG